MGIADQSRRSGTRSPLHAGTRPPAPFRLLERLCAPSKRTRPPLARGNPLERLLGLCSISALPKALRAALEGPTQQLSSLAYRSARTRLLSRADTVIPCAKSN